tara:strand:- start:102 stop:782 length:681 start_codon:yes stop_codon:yes gene_type:complete
MVLKLLSKTLAGLLFTLAFFMLFASVFGSSLISNFDSFESTFKSELSESDILVEQVASQSGLTVNELRTICQQNPLQDSCELINNPESAFEKMGLGQLKTEVESYGSIFDKFTVPMIIIFILSLIFYYLGTFSVYGALFKVSLNTLISAVLGFIAFDSMPSYLPKILNKVISSQAQEIPTELQNIILNSINAWLKISLSSLNTLFTYIIGISIASSILFYFLKKKQ